MSVRTQIVETVKTVGYPLHVLGWKAFQDLSVALAEECLQRPVQTFLPGNDAGRDGAFIGKWDGDNPAAGESTIQCKFTSKPNQNLTLSGVTGELEKARLLAEKGLAHDYIILTNHPITGQSELQIRKAFLKVGVGRCRVFGYDWIVRQILASPKLRMMAPRLYGLGDLSDLMDERAYEQAQLILSAMGDDLQRLVVTDAHRKSVRAISKHNLVLLLGSPAAGKSTIGASLAIGAADIWKCMTIKATSPDDIKRHLKPGEAQFFWIDDAWGSTQYQRHGIEAWNQILPLIRGGIGKGAKFLFTSRDYIWNSAQNDLKVQALPLLSKSQVIINVQELSTQEKGQILYNHVKLGDQPSSFRSQIKPFLPAVAEMKGFLPEVARRLGSTFFAENLTPSRDNLIGFFERPADFLLDTITNLSADCRAAIGVIFMNGGRIASPAPTDEIERAAHAFGVNTGEVRIQLEALNGSLLLLAKGEEGLYWTYKHPTVSDAFAKYVASTAELVEVYLHGARPESVVREVMCAGCEVFGASVVIPDIMHEMLAEKIERLELYQIASFLSYRSNQKFSKLMLSRKPEILSRVSSFFAPIKDDVDSSLIVKLHDQGLLPDEVRELFIDSVRQAIIEDADASIFQDDELRSVLTDDEYQEMLELIEKKVVCSLSDQVHKLREDWDSNDDPDGYFDELEASFEAIVNALPPQAAHESALSTARNEIAFAIEEMNDLYMPVSSTSAPTATSSIQITPLSNLFRDVDD